MKNPILRGFNPDPSICRVGEDYYIATSTFEWYPGVQIHHSRDLCDWRLIGRPLDQARLLDMTGVPDSCGIWAPCLSHADGLFWLIYTNARRFDGNFKDTLNYLTTAQSIDGPWSDPVYLNSSGFDPSLFHDEDGRKWLVNMVWDHRPDRSRFGGIMLQEYSTRARRLLGTPRNILPGRSHAGIEGPHLYRHDGMYYLMCADGGTGYQHAVVVARARSIEGPYEMDPQGPLLTARNDPGNALQRAGHGSLVEIADGRWFMPYLCSRPLDPHLRSPMGRETALHEVAFENGWLRASNGVRSPVPSLLGDDEPAPTDLLYTFAPPSLPLDFQWLRVPEPADLFSLDAEPGRLRLYGRDSVGSSFRQALVARRQTEHRYAAEVRMTFEPDDFQRMAGLITYYNAHKFHYLYVSYDPELRRHAGIMSCPADQSLTVVFPDWEERMVVGEGPLRLRVEVDGARQQFFIATGDAPLAPIGPVLDASLLADETGKGDGANFTGNFIGMTAQDLTGRGHHADFWDFRYNAAP